MQIKVISGLWMKEKSGWRMNKRECLFGPPFQWKPSYVVFSLVITVLGFNLHLYHLKSILHVFSKSINFLNHVGNSSL